MKSYLDKIHAFPKNGEGMDIIIISCSTQQLASFWEETLNRYKGLVTKSNAQIIAVAEDWPDGAGNGFGTLYALKKAKERLGVLKGSVALYHTAGKGTRLSPLTLAESNNKPAVKLPAILSEDSRLLSILEMVIRQTAPLAPRMKNRVSVFWSDQLFIPSIDLIDLPKTPVEVLAKKIQTPTSDDWKALGLDNYGLVTFGGQHLNKLTWDLYTQNFDQLDLSKGLGVNLGSFSLSFDFLDELLSEYSEALTAKQGKLDTDNLWMSGTLSKELLAILRPQLDKSCIKPHHYSVCDIGESSWWWDFGTLTNYYNNCMKLLGTDQEAHDLRALFGITQGGNILFGTDAGTSKIKNSILMNVQADKADLNGVIALNSNFQNVTAKDSILYNYSSNEGTINNTVKADFYSHIF